MSDPTRPTGDNTRDNEQNKFKNNSSGEVAIKTVTEITNDSSGLATETKQDNQITESQSINSKLDTLNSKDFSTSANQTILNNRIGDLNETSPTTDNSPSGLNGRLQRIAERITTFISGLTSGIYRIQQNLDNKETTGTITGVAQTVQASTNGESAALIVVSGTFSATLQIAVSKDGSTWFLNPSHVSSINPNTTQVTSPNAVRTIVAGWNFVRVYSTAYTSGTANVSISTFQHNVMTSAWQHGAWGMRVQDAAGNGIGSEGGALKVVPTPIDSGNFVTFKSNVDVNIPSPSTYTTLHSVSGSGVFVGATFVVDNTAVECRIQIDGNTIFEFTGDFLSEVVNKDADFRASGIFGVTNDGKRLYFTPNTPFRYNTSLTFSARSDNKKIKYQLYTYSVEP